MENWLEIDIKKLKSNYEYIKNKTKVIAVVKANAYGMGEFTVKELSKLGVDMFAVAFPSEAKKLRKIGIEEDILVFNKVDIDELSKDYIITIYSITQLKKYLNKDLTGIRFHLKVNTGMNRMGIDLDEVNELSEMIKKYKLNVEGIYSHFADEEDLEFTESQYILYKKFIKKFETKGIKFKIKHLANSPGAMLNSKYYFDAVRVGMLLYGLQPLPKYNPNIKTIFEWKSKVSLVRKVKKGNRISYGNEVLLEDKKIALIPVGYSHGYMRQLSKKGWVRFGDELCYILGKVCMDQIIVDVTDITIKEGDIVTVLDEKMIYKFSEICDTIADDIICKIDRDILKIERS